MRIGLKHMAIIMMPIIIFMDLVMYYSSKPEHQILNTVAYPFFIIGFFALIYFFLKYDVDKEATK